jgi:hypothetical protein
MVTDPILFFEKHQLSPRPEQADILRKLKENWGKFKYFCISALIAVCAFYL